MRSLAWLALAASLGACVTPLDRSVPRQSFRRSREALESAQRSLGTPMPGPIAVGWGRARIEAPPGVTLAGYGSRASTPSIGVHDPCFARALAVRSGSEPPALWIAADLLLIDRDTREAVAAALRGVVEPERILYTATHTHGGPGGYVDGLIYSLVAGPSRADMKTALVNALSQAARTAVGGLAPGRIAFGEIEAPGLSTNRVRKSGLPTDPVIGLVLLERDADHHRAALIAYAAHATTISDLEATLTADYPGQLVQGLEADGSLELAAFSAGAVGSMSPRAGWSEHPGAAWMGAELGRAVRLGLPRIAQALSDQRAISVLSFQVTTPPRQWRIGDELAIPLIAQSFAPTQLRVAALSMGKDTWVSLPVELSGEIAARLRARARAEGRLLVISVFGGDYGGYVVPRSAYDLPEAERGEMADYERKLMSFYGPWMGDLFAAATWRAMRAVSEVIPQPPRGPLVVVAPPQTSPPPEPPRP
ncbi:MAG: neutral/alkaline non-lysosomal ceramidase N-terminal domain-containing protein [Myxococcota bacterium]